MPFPGKWTFQYHPWLEEMHKSTAEYNVGQKAAQLGFTETVLNIVFYKIDVERVDCLYVLPAKTPDAGDFSAGRFDMALELSPHLTRLFSDVKNIGHKRAGTTNLYIRGSKSRAGLKSIPAGCIIMDEVDEFNQDNISLAFERSSGQRNRLIWLISTPSIDLKGINSFYEISTKENYFFKCPSCNRFINLKFPESLVITAESLDDPNINKSHLQCYLCFQPLPHENKSIFLANKFRNGSGDWIAEYPNRTIRGFHINQLYSPYGTVSPVDLAKAYIKSLYDPSDEQIFYNDKLGITHIVEGSKITDHQIEQAKGNYLNGETIPQNALITMGIDVGKFIHYEIDQWLLPDVHITDINTESKVKILEAGKVQDFNQLDLLMYKYRVISAVIDANPERRKAFEFADRFRGHVKMCFYGQGVYGKQIHESKTDNEPAITVNRTSWLDLALGRFRNNSITIPSNVPYEYETNLKALVRQYKKDKDGNSYGQYVKNKDDHYAHARNYAEIALPFAAFLLNPHNMKSPI